MIPADAISLDEASRLLIERRVDIHGRSVALMRFLGKVAKRHGVARHVYVVGGAVRNFLINRPIKDVDVVIDSLAAGMDASEFAARLGKSVKARHTVEPMNHMGVAFVKIKGPWELEGFDFNGEVIEIAQSRKESYGGPEGKGHKPTGVQWADLPTDVRRRDFTVNAMYWRLLDLVTGPEKAEVIDLTGLGRKDLESRILRMPIDPDESFEQDPTRMLRAIKFAAKYDLTIPTELRDSIRRNAKKLARIPKETTAKLFTAIVLRGGVLEDALALMDGLGLNAVIGRLAAKDRSFSSMLSKDLSLKNALVLTKHGIRLQKAPWSFLGADGTEFERLAQGMAASAAERLLAALKKPPIVNKVFFDEFDLKGADRRLPVVFAREALLKRPGLAKSPAALADAVLSRFAVLQTEAKDGDAVTVIGWRGPTKSRVATSFGKDAFHFAFSKEGALSFTKRPTSYKLKLRKPLWIKTAKQEAALRERAERETEEKGNKALAFWLLPRRYDALVVDYDRPKSGRMVVVFNPQKTGLEQVKEEADVTRRKLRVIESFGQKVGKRGYTVWAGKGGKNNRRYLVQAKDIFDAVDLLWRVGVKLRSWQLNEVWTTSISRSATRLTRGAKDGVWVADDADEPERFRRLV